MKMANGFVNALKRFYMVQQLFFFIFLRTALSTFFAKTANDQRSFVLLDSVSVCFFHYTLSKLQNFLYCNVNIGLIAKHFIDNIISTLT